MSLKVKLTSTILAFCLILGLLVMGVFATSTATVNLGGSLTFMATNVYAKVTGTISGTASATQPELDDIYIDDETIEGDIDTWASQDLAFKDDGTAITIEVTIENLATDRPLYVSALDTVGIVDNVTKTMANGAFVLEEQGSGNESKTITITLKVSDLNTSLPSGALYGYKFELLDESGVKEYTAVEGLTLSCDTSTKKATVTGNSISANTNLKVPAYVKSGDVVCTVTSIAMDSFTMCSRLTSITIPSSVTSIGDSAFFECSNLTSIIIPSSVTSIGTNVFDSCGKLTSLAIPSSVTNIGTQAFIACNALANIYYAGSESEWTALVGETDIGISDKLTAGTLTIHYGA